METTNRSEKRYAVRITLLMRAVLHFNHHSLDWQRMGMSQISTTHLTPGAVSFITRPHKPRTDGSVNITSKSFPGAKAILTASANKPNRPGSEGEITRAPLAFANENSEPRAARMVKSAKRLMTIIL
jgi:hypothetical protein